MFRRLIFLFIFISGLQAETCFQPGDMWVTFNEDIFFGTLQTKYTSGEGIGIKHSYTTVSTLIFPNVGWACLEPFVDLRGHYIKKNQWAGNFGGGLRWMDYTHDLIFGGNCYYDFRKTHISTYHQIGIGAEIFARCFDLRINGYFPKGHTCHSKTHLFDVPCGCGCVETEIAEKGFDFEIGRHFARNGNLCLWGSIGGYYFALMKGGGKQRWGEKLHVNITWGSFISLQGKLYHDSVQHIYLQGVLMISLPLDFTFSRFWEECTCDMAAPVERNEIISRRKKCFLDLL